MDALRGDYTMMETDSQAENKGTTTRLGKLLQTDDEAFIASLPDGLREISDRSVLFRTPP